MTGKAILLSLITALIVISGITDGIFNLRLPDIENKFVSFSNFKNNKATVFVFLLTDCPASQSYTLTLNKLAKNYRNNNVLFVGVFPGKYASDKEIIEFKKIYKITFPLIKDPEMVLARKLNATIAPGCFVLDSKENIIYKGRIDDWMYAVGKKRQVITENNLDDALQALLKNIPVKKKETNPIGCILEYGN
jgi:thiol-disulfide isomerase/thioredoxin